MGSRVSLRTPPHRSESYCGEALLWKNAVFGALDLEMSPFLEWAIYNCPHSISFRVFAPKRLEVMTCGKEQTHFMLLPVMKNVN